MTKITLPLPTTVGKPVKRIDAIATTGAGDDYFSTKRSTGWKKL